MAILDKNIITTSFNGDLHVFKQSSIDTEKSNLVGKTYPAHSCKINQIEVFKTDKKQILYTTGEQD